MTNDIAYSRAVKGNILQFSMMQCNVTLTQNNELNKKQKLRQVRLHIAYAWRVM